MGERTAIPIFEEKPFDKAEELIAALLPHQRSDGFLWKRGDEEGWMFRGQAETHWKLTPKAFRDEAFLPFDPFHDSTQALDAPTRRAREEHLVKEFASRASHHGIEIPGDSQALRDADYAYESDGADFPPILERGIYALAQHSGIPTRLLDWSWSPLVAAYFGAIEPAQWWREGRPKAPHSEGRFAIWAVQRHYVDRECRSLDPGAVVVTVPGSSNPNLRAQAGVFTLVRFVKIPPEAHELPTLDEVIKDPQAITMVRGREGAPTAPMMYKFTLPHTEAAWLLYLLSHLQVNHATLFPGHAGVVQMMREKKFWQKSR